jgi:putative Mg2+ transporter-C (MgtC) family protein
MDELRLLPRLLVALVLGIVLGIERERKHKPAGLRTHAVVTLSTAGLMGASSLLQTSAGGAIVGDPVRMSQGILTGIGFIGAGAILRHRTTVTGITTAATIWLSASVGILAGAGFYVLAVSITLLTVLSLASLDRIAGRMGNNEARAETELEGEEND